MHAKLLAAALILALPGVAGAQETQIPAPGLLCPDGSDPQITGTGCAPIQQRNAIDEGMASTTLPQQTPTIQVPNDPLGSSVGNSAPIDTLPGGTGNLGGFGNSAMQQPKIR